MEKVKKTKNCAEWWKRKEDVTRVLQMLEASWNVSRFADTIEYTMFAQDSGIT